jgi:hypothetical protein
MRSAALIGCALVGVPVTFAAFVAVGYRFSWTPFYSPVGSATLFVVMGALSVFGAVLIALSSPVGSRCRLRVAYAVLYMIAMVPTLFLVGLYSACLNGDCI